MTCPNQRKDCEGGCTPINIRNNKLTWSAIPWKRSVSRRCPSSLLSSSKHLAGWAHRSVKRCGPRHLGNRQLNHWAGTLVIWRSSAAPHRHSTASSSLGLSHVSAFLHLPRLLMWKIALHRPDKIQGWSWINRGDASDQSYRSGAVGKVDTQLAHSSNDGHQTLDCVAVDHRTVLLTFLLRVTCLMDNLHLLHNCTLAWLTGTLMIKRIHKINIQHECLHHNQTTTIWTA